VIDAGDRQIRHQNPLVGLTQEQLLSAWTGFVPALAPAVPTLIRLLGSVQRGAKKEIIA
jgi:hypothetical protein